ncbi:MAG: type II toxin-antitoxin system VapC family toxin [Planctomycetes bacterium]|nr:type II toxin-antitoxin system VapC family toxin [Planctomycetota bacterium]
MSTYLLDTVSFSRLMERHPRVTARVRSTMQTHIILISSVVRGEVRFGLKRMPRGRRRSRLEATADNLFVFFPSVPVSDDISETYSDIKVAAEQQGTPLGENDLWIAATALGRGAILVSSDSDFRRVRGLEVEDWTE